MPIARALVGAALVLSFCGGASAQQGSAVSPAEAEVGRVMGGAKFKEAMAHIDRDHDRIIEENIELQQIPAPLRGEERKARAFMGMLGEAGLADVRMDEEGNVTGVRKGTGGGGLVAIASHLDTVFPEGTDLSVERDGTRIKAPGIADDTRGLAVMLGMIRAMNAAGVEHGSDILFVGDVGEEGLGDLRGMKYLFGKGPYKDKIETFIAFDARPLRTS